MADPRVDEAISAGRVPEHVTAEFLNESQDGPAIVGIIFVTSLTFLIVAGRLLSRTLVVKRFGLDDGLALLSLITFIPFVVLCIELIVLGSGRHFEYIRYVLDVPTIQQTQVLDFAAHIVYATALLFCRISGLTFYHRICGLHKEYLVAIKALFGLLVAGYLPQLLLIVFHCRPLTGLWPYGWEPYAEDYECLSWGIVYVTISSISLVCDFLLFGIPVVMLWNLEMPRKRKMQLGCILFPGMAVIGISITRLVLVVRGQWESDMSWTYNAMLGVEVSEIGATLIALSIPGVKPLVDRYILRKQAGPKSSSYRYPDKEASLESAGTPLSDLKRRSQYNMLVNEGAAQYDTEVSAAPQFSNMSPAGIQVKVDFDVKDGLNRDHVNLRGSPAACTKSISAS